MAAVVGVGERAAERVWLLCGHVKEGGGGGGGGGG